LTIQIPAEIESFQEKCFKETGNALSAEKKSQSFRLSLPATGLSIAEIATPRGDLKDSDATN